MANSIFIAKLLGPVLVVAGITYLANMARLKEIARDFLESPGMLFMAGIMTLVLGLTLVNTHNVWVAGWPVIITIFGWIAIFSGLVRTMMPATVAKWGEAMIGNTAYLKVVSGLLVALGAYLSWMGYSPAF